MAKDDFINKTIDEYVFDIMEEAHKLSFDDNMSARGELRRVLRLFAKDVERETRHAAAELATKLASDIQNL